MGAGGRLVVQTRCPEGCYCGSKHEKEGTFELKGVPLDVMKRIIMVCDNRGVKYDLCLSTDKTNPVTRRNSDSVRRQESISTRPRSKSGPPPARRQENIPTPPVEVEVRPRSRTGPLPRFEPA